MVRQEKQFVQGKMEVAGIMGPIWIMGWLFTIGFCQLAFGKALLAVALWPYYLGVILRGS
jgi:hypothetical protein